jgi:type I restriction enzyme M protein
MNKKDAPKRKHVVFINADREYREGKAQNFLRAEDISRIVHAYRTLTSGERDELPGYARRVPIEEIEGEDFNCNIRRYVDNAPPPEPHDVRAHLHGGVPKSEIDTPSSICGRTTLTSANAASSRGQGPAPTWTSPRR